MAIVIMGGLAVGTVLTLAVVPALYSLLFNFRRSRRSSEPALMPTNIAEPA
jgi:Cu/Ag efflux pump CusA